MSRQKTKMVSFKMPDAEIEILTMYSEQVNRTKTDILREFIRALKSKIKK